MKKFTGWLATLACAGLLSACGGGGGSAGTVTNGSGATTAKAASVVLTASSSTLASSGADGVTIKALVRDASNSVLSGVTVTLTANSGSLTNTTRVTDSTGTVTETLSTGGDSTSRAITVTAAVSGVTSATTVINVTGNKLTINAASTVNVGASSDITVQLLDSAGAALSGKDVTYSSNANTLAVKGGGAAVTNAAGQLVLTYTASGGSADVITVKSMGETAAANIAINASTFAMRVLDASGNVETSANIGGCQQVAVTGGPSGTVSISTSRGTVYSNATCTTALSGALALTGGAATAYVNATGPGVATLTATASGVTTQTSLEFVAPLTAISTISLQATPAVIGVNSGTSTSQQSTLRAVVRDGSAQNNLVKNASVSFSIVTDPSGGSLTQPTVVVTGSDGAATTSFIAGSTASALNGVQIQAKLIGGSGASATANLTVAQQSLFISAGTGNTVGVPTTTTYQKDYVVFVTDASGNAVSGVTLTASVVPVTYYKGYLAYTSPSGPWEPVIHVACANEDSNNNGILDAGEDVNGNGTLEPGIPLTVTPSVTTDSTGQATVSLLYPRDHVNWLDVNLVIRGSTGGTESTYTSLVHLAGLSSDYTSQTVSPPGVNSPYGVSTSCSNPN